MVTNSDQKDSTMNSNVINTLLLLFLLATLSNTRSVNGHIDTPCQHLAVYNFTPCFNLVTGSNVNGSSSTDECCHEMNKLSHFDIDCACLLLIGTVPAQFTFLRSLQVVLPRSCNVSGVPLQCKGYGTPLPAPGPTLAAPDPSPAAPAPTLTGSAPTTIPAKPAGTEAPRPDGQKIPPVLNHASNAHSISKPVAAFTLWYLITVALSAN